MHVQYSPVSEGSQLRALHHPVFCCCLLARGCEQYNSTSIQAGIIQQSSTPTVINLRVLLRLLLWFFVLAVEGLRGCSAFHRTHPNKISSHANVGSATIGGNISRQHTKLIRLCIEHCCSLWRSLEPCSSNRDASSLLPFLTRTWRDLVDASRRWLQTV